jgi:cytochrome c oxidase subunit III
MATAVFEENLGQNAWGGGVSPMNASYGKLMMWFFLLSDAITFTGLLVSYGFNRFDKIPNIHPDEMAAGYKYMPSIDKWPIPEFVYDAFPFCGHAHLPLVFVGLMTFILILSSVTMVLAVDAGHRMDKKSVEKWMLWTIAGGLTFLGCQAWEWVHFIHGTSEGMTLATGEIIHGANLKINQYGPPAFGDFFFFITGFHGTHVLSGVIINIVIFYCVVTGVYQKRGHYEMVEKVGLYWHFVDLVWVFVFTFFYLV